MKKKSLNFIYFGIFLLTLGIVAITTSYKIKNNYPVVSSANILLINSIHESGESLIKDFKKSKNNEYKNIQRIFFHNIFLLRGEIVNYNNNVLIKGKTRNNFLYLFLALAGLYYIFAFIGFFHLRFNSYARLRIAVSLWILTIIALFLDIYISTTSYNLLIDRLQILQSFIPLNSQNTLLIQQTLPFLSPLLFFALLLNMIIYITFPLWYINLKKVKKYFT